MPEKKPLDLTRKKPPNNKKDRSKDQRSCSYDRDRDRRSFYEWGSGS